MNLCIRTEISGILLGALLWGLSFSLSCSIYSSMSADPEHQIYAKRSIMGTILSQARFALSGQFYLMADRYFHKGVGHISGTKLQNHFFTNLQRQISPSGHIHASGSEVKEIMPWLRLATFADPHNVQAYLVTAFWLRKDAGRPDLALDVLEEAQLKNPANTEIRMEKARIYLGGKQFSNASKELQEGLALLSEKKHFRSKEDKFIKSQMLMYSALLHEIRDEKEKAISQLREIIELFPERKSINKRIESLENEQQHETPAYQILRNLIKQDAKASNSMMFHDKPHKTNHSHSEHRHTSH